MGAVMVRNSADQSPPIFFPGSAWREFTAALARARVEPSADPGMLGYGARSSGGPVDESRGTCGREWVGFECS
jgi:hypothetical protein